MTRKRRTAIVTAIVVIAISAPTSAFELTTELVADGLSQPLFVTAPVGDNQRLFIVEQGGQIRIIVNGQLLATPFLDIDDLVRSGGEQGMLGLSFHPDYADNGFFYVNYTDNDGDTVVARYSRSNDPNVADPNSALVILTIDQPFSNHNGGCLAFGPLDGYLYISSGDGGGGGDIAGNAQNRQTRLGKLLRIDVDAAAPFGIPATNPFGPTTDAQDTTLDEIWAFGLRNPWRFSFDRETGDLYIADVGQSRREEINFQAGTSPGGENYGWNVKEGSACFSPAVDCVSNGMTEPILDYGNIGGECSVTGGYVYRGTAIDGLQGTYFFADFCSARIWSFRLIAGEITDFIERTEELNTDGGPAIGSISSFGEDAEGELYICDLGGSVYKIVPRPVDQVPDSCPATAGIEVCNDEVDNNGDGLIDADDPLCPQPCTASFCGICIVPGAIVTLIGFIGLKRTYPRSRRKSLPADRCAG